MRFYSAAVILLSIFTLQCLSSPAPHHKKIKSVVSITSTSTSTGVSTSGSVSSSFSSRTRSTSSSLRPPSSTYKPTSSFKTTSSTLKSTPSTSTKPSTTSLPKSTLSSSSTLTSSSTALPTGKRGILYNSPATNIQHFNDPGSKVTWAYNWDSLMDSNFPSYMEFVPMLWGNASVHTTNWKKNVQNAISRGTKAILAFNEPDACGGGQSCMTPQAAVDAYRTYIQPFAGQVKLGGPAVTEVGTAWLLQFLSLCVNCTIDFIPMHIYNSATNVAYYKAHMTDIANQTGKPIWLTEFSASGDQTQFLETLMPWMDTQPFIQRYSWFMCSPTYSGTTCGSNGYPNALGQVYELF